MSNQSIYQQLSESFPKEMERTVNKGGAALVYVPISEVINRMNRVFGVDKWSYTIVKCERDVTDQDFVIAHVRVQYFPDASVSVTREGFGGQKIKRTKQGAVLDLGDEFKGAISDALKKAAQAFGVGLYLARSEEAMEAEQSIEAEFEYDAKSPLWGNFVALAKGLDPEQKNKMREIWKEKTNGAPVPTSIDSVSVDDLKFIVSEVNRIKAE